MMKDSKEYTMNIIKSSPAFYLIASQVPEELAILIFIYAYPFFRLHCPVSGEPFSRAIVLTHPQLASVVYNRSSVVEAIRSGELETFGISEDNLPRESIAIKDHSEVFPLLGRPLFTFLNNQENLQIDLAVDFQAAQQRRDTPHQILALLAREATPITLRRPPILRTRKAKLYALSLGLIFNVTDNNFTSILWRSKGMLQFFALGLNISYYATQLQIDYEYLIYFLRPNTLRTWFIPERRLIPILSRFSIILCAVFMSLITYYSHPLRHIVPFPFMIVCISVISIIRKIITILVPLDILIRENQRQLPREIIRDRHIFVALCLSTLIGILGHILSVAIYSSSQLAIMSVSLNRMTDIPSLFLAIRQSTTLLADCKSTRSIRPLLPIAEHKVNAISSLGSKVSNIFSSLCKILGAFFIFCIMLPFSKKSLEERLMAIGIAAFAGIIFLMKTSLIHYVGTRPSMNQYHLLSRPQLNRVEITELKDRKLERKESPSTSDDEDGDQVTETSHFLPRANG